MNELADMLERLAARGDQRGADAVLDAARQEARRRAPSRRHRRAKAVGAVALLLLGAIGAVVALRSDHDSGTTGITVTSIEPAAATTTVPPDSDPQFATPTMVARIPAVGGRMQVLTTADAVWVAGQGIGDQSGPASLQRVDPLTNTVTATVTVDGTVHDIVEAFGSIWVCGTELHRVDPATATISATYDEPCMAGITEGFGSLWLSRVSSVQRLGPDGTREATIDVAGGGWGIAAGAGSIWVADGSPGPGTVSRINPETNAVVATIDVPGRSRDFLISDDGVWITSEGTLDRPLSLVIVDPGTDMVRARIDEPGESTGITELGDYVWAATHGGGLSVFDRRTNELRFFDRFLPAGATLGGDQLAYGFGSIWMVTQHPGAILRIDPGRFG